MKVSELFSHLQLYSSYLTYHSICKGINDTFSGTWLSGSFSTDKDDLIFEFQAKNFHRQLIVRFADGELYLTIPNQSVKPGRNCINQFRELWNQKLVSAEHKPFDRIVYLNFENGDTLMVKGFGRFGNLLHFRKGDNLPSSIFRTNLKNDWEFPLPEKDGIYLELWNKIKNQESLDQVLSFLKPDQRLKTAEALSEAGNLSGVKQILNTIAGQSGKAAIKRIGDNTWPEIVFSDSAESSTERHNSDILFQYAEEYLRWFYFTRQKNALIQKYQTEIRHLEKLEAETLQTLDKVKKRRSYRELGDIILSNAHLIKKGISEAFVPDIYSGGHIRLRLDANLDAVGNAERYYRKSKNEVQEINKLEENLANFRTRLDRSREKLSEANHLSLNQAGQLKKMIGKNDSVAKSFDTKPYKEFTIMGYQVWMGKTAAGNDEMLRQAGKNDLWLHARSVSGSHVIIRKKGNVFPREIIEAAAILAARNSKAKHQKVVPVIYTERKYVVKSKGSNPGEVRLLKEQVIDVTLGK